MAKRVVVCGFIGTGTHDDMFRPDVDDSGADSCSIIDLSADPTAPDVCIAVLDYGSRVAPTARNTAGNVVGLDDIGTDALTALPTTRRNRLASRLGTTLRAGDTIVPAIMARIGADLRPEKDGMLRLRCGSLVLHEQPAVRGGASDNFNYSDGNLDTVSGGIWDNPYQTIPTVVSNSVATPTNSTVYNAVYQTTTGSDDNYSQIVVTIAGASGFGEGIAVVRSVNTGTETFYRMGWTTGNLYQIARIVAGAFTSMATGNTNGAPGVTGTHTIKGECQGSTLRCYSELGLELTTTNTAITTGQFVGFGAFHGTVRTVTLDTWQGRAYAVSHTSTPTDNLGLTDTVATLKASVSTITDNLGLTDTVATTITSVQEVTDNLGLTDTVTVAKSISVTIVDNLGLTDTGSAVDRSTTVTDGLGLTDTVATSKSITATITDDLDLTDVLDDLDQILVDVLGLTDTVTASLVGPVGNPGVVCLEIDAPTLSLAVTLPSLVLVMSEDC